VDGQHASPLGIVDLREIDLLVHAGNRDQQLDESQLVEHPLHGRFDGLAVGDVAPQRQVDAVGRRQIEARDGPAVRLEALGDRGADAARGPGDERDPTP
jgi:hypothetical protein